MKKYFLLLLVLFLMQNTFAATSKPVITVRVEKYDPVPAEPGNVFDVWVGIENKGTSAENMRVRMIDAFPFSSQTPLQEIGIVPENEKLLAHFIVKADPSAQNKNYNLTFEYQWGDTTKWWTQSSSQIQMRLSDASVSVNDYHTTEKEIVPGSSTEIEITLENTGRTTVKDIDVILDAKQPFSTISTSTTKRISLLHIGEKMKIVYPIIADPSAEPRVYTLPITIIYSDDRNNKYTKSTSLSVQVNAKPDLLIVADSVTQTNEGVRISLNAINKGIVTVKYLTIRLLEGDGFIRQSIGDTQYLGNVESDDSELADFVIIPQKRTLSLPIEATFKDPYNKEFNIKTTIVLVIPEEKKETSVLIYFASGIAIALLVGTFFVWRRKRK